jgi:hypothetical protein
MSWFIQWENSVKSNEKIRNKEKCLISHQTRFLTFSDISDKQAPAAPPVFDFLETESCPRITEFMALCIVRC